jgi:TonB family protein
MTVAANTPPTSTPIPIPIPKTVARPEPLQPGPELNETLSSNKVLPVPPHHESAAVSLPSDGTRQRSTPGSTDVSNVFAHPEAAAAIATNQVPPPVFRPKDPVLIPRNKSATADAAPEPQGAVHTGSMGSMVANLMYSPDPEYPAEAIAAGVEGEVTVRAVVGPHGNVVDASVVSGPPLLREAALDAVGRWRYRPYEQDGKPVTMATTAIFDFQIPPKN